MDLDPHRFQILIILIDKLPSTFFFLLQGPLYIIGLTLPAFLHCANLFF